MIKKSECVSCRETRRWERGACLDVCSCQKERELKLAKEVIKKDRGYMSEDLQNKVGEIQIKY